MQQKYWNTGQVNEALSEVVKVHSNETSPNIEVINNLDSYRIKDIAIFIASKMKDKSAIGKTFLIPILHDGHWMWGELVIGNNGCSFTTHSTKNRPIKYDKNDKLDIVDSFNLLLRREVLIQTAKDVVFFGKSSLSKNRQTDDYNCGRLIAYEIAMRFANIKDKIPSKGVYSKEFCRKIDELCTNSPRKISEFINLALSNSLIVENSVYSSKNLIKKDFIVKNNSLSQGANATKMQLKMPIVTTNEDMPSQIFNFQDIYKVKSINELQSLQSFSQSLSLKLPLSSLRKSFRKY
ncbi:hypothetical protein [Candidatus Deianiraea vastatrix]|uniref:Uncharacterized protein n=1 Tax=Candidatus Deianiraea vastatrix TaxID=2163644 RepID=A0A5B8XEW7_9RICK|nr:hypothetical protein [Candidatus Deianiraea vastatrix]QED23516.1 hypothetical protein Deia_00725 [Candidatus Deianiraea vastatrix]